MEKLHTPERLDGETLERYHHRQHISRLAAKQSRVIIKTRNYVSPKRSRRALTGAVGARQARKALKLARMVRASERAQAVTAEALTYLVPNAF